MALWGGGPCLSSGVPTWGPSTLESGKGVPGLEDSLWPWGMLQGGGGGWGWKGGPWGPVCPQVPPSAPEVRVPTCLGDDEDGDSSG